MGFYLLPKTVHEEMDSIRGKFFGEGLEKTSNTTWPRWKPLADQKTGGLGIINTHIMNECLLAKWIWKITKGSNETWYKLLQAKYMQDGNFFNSKCRGASQFWQGLHKVKHLFKWGAEHRVRSRGQTFFWEDVWLGGTPLKIQFCTNSATIRGLW
jgi:hypothetical protein